MKVEIVSIGDELLIGQTINTNASWMGNTLSLEGFEIVQNTVISDQEEDIVRALKAAELKADIILITGGLGPTKDDVTKHVLCNYFNTQLVRNEEILKRIEQFFTSRGREMLESNKQQADLPESCIILPNSIGTASGMWFEERDKIFVSLPGVPYEMKDLMNKEVIPRLQNKFSVDRIIHKTILTQGIGESFLAEKIKEWENKLRKDQLSLAYLPSPGLVRLRISAKGKNIKQLEEQIHHYSQTLLPFIKDYFFGYENDSLEEVIGKKLIRLNATLSTAESCTGGYISHKITSVSGSSAYYLGSVISYSNQVKIQELQVSSSDLANFGAVSQQVVEQMAQGVLQKIKSDYSIAVSGVAGPDGGSEDKPVGMVWIAVSSKEKTISKVFQFENDRNRNITRATWSALMMLNKLLDEKIK